MKNLSQPLLYSEKPRAAVGLRKGYARICGSQAFLYFQNWVKQSENIQYSPQIYGVFKIIVPFISCIFF